MADIQSKISDIYSLEAMSVLNSTVHNINPAFKIAAVVAYIISVISFDRYDLIRLAPYLFFPVILTALAGIPLGLILKRSMIALPFAAFAGIANLIFDSKTAVIICSLNISFGLISFIVLMIRTVLCVSAVLILIATTPFTKITATMRFFHIPSFFILMCEMIYRYIAVLAGESANMYTAYSLRSGDNKGIKIKDMGSFIGSLFIRSFDRAERVYAAMRLRGYGESAIYTKKLKINKHDLIFLFITILPIIFFRIVNVYSFL